MSFCISVEASNKIGMGHLMESMCLANSLRKRTSDEIFFLVNDFEPALDIISKSKYPFKIISDNLQKKDKMDLMISFIKKNKSKILIVDKFKTDYEFFTNIKSFTDMLVVILDNTDHRPIDADIAVNFNVVQDDSYYSALPISQTVYCIGPKYFLLPEELHELWERDKFIPEDCKTIFVNQGGSDPHGLTIKIIKNIESMNLKQRVIVIIGHGMLTEHKNEIDNLKPKLKNLYDFEYNLSQIRMYELMRESDLAITAAGNTLYELAIFGIPSLVVCHHERHNQVAMKFEEKNAVINLGIGADLSCDTIVKEVEGLLYSSEKRRILSSNMRKIVDGLGSMRVAEKILEISQIRTVSIK